MLPVVVGTAGHIDHGKSALVKALTGTDPDRLAEERRRGITIDLGFASAEVAGRLLSFVDVPGHERLIRNMLAGATGIDLMVLVVAADESVMPQTREHLAIAQLLGVGTGVVALTKVDLVDSELAEVAAEEVRDLVAGTFLAGAPVVPVSALTGEGLETLGEALARAAATVPPRDEDGIPRLPIDRAFVLKGFGTVVTGTLSGGPLASGEEVEAVPGGPRARIRGLQVHGEAASRGEPGSRLAVNLGGVPKEAFRRGMVLAPCDLLPASQIWDTVVQVLPNAPRALCDLVRVRVHHGTAEVMARLRPLGRTTLEPGASGPAQLRLERPVAALPGDRFVLRRYSPLCTLGGGVLVDLDPPKARRGDPHAAERTERLDGVSPRDRALVLVETAGPGGWDVGGQVHRLGLAPRAGAALLVEMVAEGAIVEVAERYLLPAVREDLATKIEATIRDYHEHRPLEEGMLREVLRSRTAAALLPESFRTLLRGLEEEGRVRLVRDAVALPDHRPGLTPEQETITRKILSLLLEAGLEPPAEWTLLEQVEDRKEGQRLLRFLEKEGRIIRLGDGRYFHGQPVEALRRKLRERVRQGEETIDVPAFKRLAGVTRKSAIPLLERFDAEQLTVRRGDLRVIRGDS